MGDTAPTLGHMGKTTVEIALTSGLAEYVIENGDLSKVPDAHRNAVAAALGTATPILEQTPVTAPETEPTAAPTKRGKE